MPTLQFKGKNIIWNHHMSVPYHTLDPVKDLDFQPEQSNGNLIVEGDNLVALKALLPEYRGRVKCIYIDPPYNTGNEGWSYNDNVSSPMINEWLGQEVAKDDLTKHDKWLCMMTPRLKLLNELLIPEEGIIFISIDDNEHSNLKLLCDEIFGEENFLGNIVRATGQTTGQDSGGLGSSFDFLLVYGKNSSISLSGLPLTQKDLKRFDNEDERGKYAYDQMRKTGSNDKRTDRPNMYYSISDPDGNEIYPIAPAGYESCWRFEKKTYERLIDEGYILWKKTKRDNKEIWWPYVKYYLEGRTKRPSPLWNDLDGNKKAARDLRELFDGEKVFDFPKPTALIKRCIQIAPNASKDDIILDSFAGSGTTAHAVMELNKEDGGNRQYIVVQMPENSDKELDKNICRDITRERIVRAVDMYGYESGFEYVRVGQALDAETLLEGELPSYETFAKYVYYLAMGEHLEDDQNIDQESYFVGTKNNQDIYLIYDDNMEALQSLALNYEKAESFRARSGEKKVIVYAPACFLDEEDLQEMKIEFVSIPYNLFSKNQEV
jgi:adenine-specific DNA-methyltransferase